MTVAMQRLSVHVAEVTTSIFNLEDEEIKGKIIGRGEGISAPERETGVEFIIDETPER